MHVVNADSKLLYHCYCGAHAPLRSARWNGWIQLQPHRQPKTGLLCSTGRLLRVVGLTK